MGVEVHMLTGDNPAAAARVAKALDIRCWQAGVRPDGRRGRLPNCKRGERVGMAGDGVNDAPALAQADVSLAMGGGSHVAIETADITLMHGDLLAAADAIDLSRRTLAKIRQNLFLPLFTISWAFRWRRWAGAEPGDCRRGHGDELSVGGEQCLVAAPLAARR